MPTSDNVVVTGIGVISPIGVGRQAVWQSLSTGTSGIRPLEDPELAGLPVRIAGTVIDFDPREYVKPRKSLKVMARDAQFAVAVADLARSDAGLSGEVDPERIGVLLGAGVMRAELQEISACYGACLENGVFNIRRWGAYGLPQCFPLGMLRLLPNMLASHISITQDARGPNNTICQAEASGLLAIGEATRVVQRGLADVMLAGGARCALHPYDLLHMCLCAEVSTRNEEPQRASRPFDRQRSGQVIGEGAGLLVLESAAHATARKADPLVRVLGWGSAYEGAGAAGVPPGEGYVRAIQQALRDANVQPAEVGHINAHGLSTRADDRVEAAALARVLPGVPVLAPKSYFGNLLEASGAVEAVVSILALLHGEVPATLNYEHPDPDCPVSVTSGAPLKGRPPTALVLNRTPQGQYVAMLFGLP